MAAEATGDAYNHWSLGLYDGQFYLRYAPTLGFSVAEAHARMALSLLLASQERVDRLPALHLRAASDADLARLSEVIPAELQTSISSQTLADAWSLDFGSSAIDLCQGDFSQRLPIERWWKLWKSVAIFARTVSLTKLALFLERIPSLASGKFFMSNLERMRSNTASPKNSNVSLYFFPL